MMRKVLISVLLSVAAAAAGAATPEAAGPVLSVDHGTVLVNDGSQFVSAKPGQALKPGDRVMVMTGGSATVKYADGHSSAIPSGSLVSFDSRQFGGYTPQAVAAQSSTPVGPMYAQAVGTTPADPDDDTSCSNQAKHCAAWIFAGVLGVAVIAGVSHSGHHDHALSAP